MEGECVTWTYSRHGFVLVVGVGDNGSGDAAQTLGFNLPPDARVRPCKASQMFARHRHLQVIKCVTPLPQCVTPRGGVVPLTQ
ncbi:hypothetical protein FKM82_028211 [Ascaphus truei]